MKEIMNIVPRKPALLLAWFLTCLTTAAQDPPSADKSSNGIELRLLAVALLNSAESVVLKSGKAETQPIELPTHGLSEPIQVTARTLSVATPSKGEQSGRILDTLQLPGSGRRFLLLLIPTKNAYASRVVRLDDPGFDPGDLCFLNLTEVPVGGTLGPGKFLARQGIPEIVAAPEPGDKPFYQVRFFYKDAEQTRPLADTRWPHDEQVRTSVFFFRNPQSGRLTYRAVDEDIPSGQ